MTETTEVTAAGEPQDAQVSAPPAAVPPSAEPRPPRFGPGFGWGLAAGVFAVLILGLCATLSIGVFAYLTMQKSIPDFGSPNVVVSPVTAAGAKGWFTVNANGTGTLQGWSTGSSGGSGEGPAGSVGFFEIGTVGSLNGVKVTYSIPIYLDNKTRIFIGTQEYGKGKSKSPAEVMFGSMDSNGPPDEMLQDRPITVQFHRQGQYIIADRISAPLETQTSPLSPDGP